MSGENPQTPREWALLACAQWGRAEHFPAVPFAELVDILELMAKGAADQAVAVERLRIADWLEGFGAAKWQSGSPAGVHLALGDAAQSLRDAVAMEAWSVARAMLEARREVIAQEREAIKDIVVRAAGVDCGCEERLLTAIRARKPA